MSAPHPRGRPAPRPAPLPAAPLPPSPGRAGGSRRRPLPPGPVLPALLLLPLAGPGCRGPGGEPQEAREAAEGEEVLVVADVGFQTPESVLHDPVADLYLVSNINGAPTAKDDNGFISRLSPDGTVRELRWIDGAREDVTLHAPKGMGIRGDTLFVADIDCLRYFHRETGEPIWELCFEGAAFLNDVAVGPDGSVYVSDSGTPERRTDAVYRLDRGADSVLRMAHGEWMGRPNGLAADSLGLIVVTFGSGQIYRLAPDGSQGLIVRESPGQLDGLVLLEDGSLVVSTWGGSAVHRLHPDGNVVAVAEEVRAPADIGHDAKRGRILIPLFHDDRVEIRALR